MSIIIFGIKELPVRSSNKNNSRFNSATHATHFISGGFVCLFVLVFFVYQFVTLYIYTYLCTLIS